MPDPTEPHGIAPATKVWSVPQGTDQHVTYGDMHTMIHRDIALGNDYRKERIKLLIALATGVFALTVIFHKDLFDAVVTANTMKLLFGGWALMIVSLGAGIVHLGKWEDFYLEHRASGSALWRYWVASRNLGGDKTRAEQDYVAARARIDTLQDGYRAWHMTQAWSLVMGLVLIALYAGYSGSAMLDERMRVQIEKAAARDAAKEAASRPPVPSGLSPSSPVAKP